MKKLEVLGSKFGFVLRRITVDLLLAGDIDRLALSMQAMGCRRESEIL